MHVFIEPPPVQQIASPAQEERLSEEVPGASAGTYVDGPLYKDQEDSSEVRSELKRKMSDLDSQPGICIMGKRKGGDTQIMQIHQCSRLCKY